MRRLECRLCKLVVKLHTDQWLWHFLQCPPPLPQYWLPLPGRIYNCHCTVYFSLSNFAQKASQRICMKFSGKVDNGPMNRWLYFGGNPDHRLHTRIVFPDSSLYWDGESASSNSFILIRQMAAVVIIKLEDTERFARWRDWYGYTGETCLGGGMHCRSASSCQWN